MHGMDDRAHGRRWRHMRPERAERRKRAWAIRNSGDQETAGGALGRPEGNAPSGVKRVESVGGAVPVMTTATGGSVAATVGIAT